MADDAPAASAALDALWERLSEAVAAAGPDPVRERLFLAKLALLLAREVGDARRVAELIAVARRDLS